MKKNKGCALIIAGTAGVGKTELAKKYANVLDLESALFYWDNSALAVADIEKQKGDPKRKPNPQWPMNYINAIKQNQTKYDYVLICPRVEHENPWKPFTQNGIDFEMFIPEKDAIAEYEQRFISRGNSPEWAKRVYARYDEFLPLFLKLGDKLKILKKGETLESYLLCNQDKYTPLIPR